jgi:hypothetical protein
MPILHNLREEVDRPLALTKGTDIGSKYTRSLLFNLATSLRATLYGALSKLWIANIDSSQVVTTDVHTYIGITLDVLYKGLSRSAWLLVRDNSTQLLSSLPNHIP